MKKLNRMAFSAIIFVFVTGFMLFAGGGAETPAEENSTQILRVGLRLLTTIDPALGANDPDVMFNSLQYDYLIDITPEGNLEPNLARSWEISEDGLSYTFYLEPDVQFEDGSPFTADDVVFTFNRLVSAGSSIVGLLGQKAVGEDGEGNPVFEPTWTVNAVDELTVRFNLEQINADFLFGVASRFALILKDGSEEVNVISSGDDPYVNFNGTGPFVLVDYRPDERAVFEANENYWQDGAPALDGIELVFFDDNRSQIDALQTGVLDYIIKIPDDLVDSANRIPEVTVVNRPTNTHPVIRLLTDEGSIGEDPRIRQAFKYATDRELLNIDALGGNGVVGNNDPIGPVYGELYNAVENRSYDPERAKALIADVYADGGGNGFIVEVNGEPRIQVPFYVGDTFEYGLVAEFIQQQWADAGIDVDLNVIPESVYYADNENNWLNTQVGMTAWGARPTPQEYLSVAYTTGAAFNEARWSNAALDALAAEASRTSDPAARAAIYARISQIFFDEGPIIIPYFRPVIGAFSNRVRNLDMHSFPGRTDFRRVRLED
jgi:peptide/nickel transport system substrate-binding protein